MDLQSEVESWRRRCEALLEEKLELAQKAGDDARTSSQQIISLISGMHATIAQKDSIIGQLCLNRNSTESAALVTNETHAGHATSTELESALQSALEDAARLREALAETERLNRSEAQQRTIQSSGATDPDNSSLLLEKDQEIARLNSRVTDLDAETRNHIADNKTLMLTMQQKESEITSLRAVINGNQVRDEQSAKYISYLRKRIEGLEGQLSEVKSALRESRSQVRTLEDDLSNQIQTLKAEMDAKNQSALNEQQASFESLRTAEAQIEKQRQELKHLTTLRSEDHRAAKIAEEDSNLRLSKLMEEVKKLRQDRDETQLLKDKQDSPTAQKSHAIGKQTTTQVSANVPDIANGGRPTIGTKLSVDLGRQLEPNNERSAASSIASDKQKAEQSKSQAPGTPLTPKSSILRLSLTSKSKEQSQPSETANDRSTIAANTPYLEAEFLKNKFPKREERQLMAEFMTETSGQQVTESQVHTWFVSKRQIRDSRTPQQLGSLKRPHPPSSERKSFSASVEATPVKTKTALKNTPKSQKNTPRRHKTTPAQESSRLSGASELEVRTPDKHLARPGAPQGPDGLQRLTELIFVALKAAKDSGVPSPNKVIETILHLESMGDGQPLSESQSERVHAVIVKSFPLIAPWQIQAWKAAIEKMRLHVLSDFTKKNKDTISDVSQNQTAGPAADEPSAVALPELKVLKCVDCNNHESPSTFSDLVHHWDVAHEEISCPVCPISEPVFVIRGILDHFKGSHPEISSSKEVDDLRQTLQTPEDEHSNDASDPSGEAGGETTELLPRDPDEAPTTVENVSSKEGVNQIAETTEHLLPILEQATGSADAKIPRPDIKQSNRCTTCIESHKYCNGEPICETCRTYYLGWALPEKYCIYPFVKKDIPQWKITPKNFIPPSTMSKGLISAILSPANNFGKFWRPTTEKDFPQLSPSKKTKIRGHTPTTPNNETVQQSAGNDTAVTHINISDDEEEENYKIDSSVRRSAKRRRLIIAESSSSETEARAGVQKSISDRSKNLDLAQDQSEAYRPNKIEHLVDETIAMTPTQPANNALSTTTPTTTISLVDTSSVPAVAPVAAEPIAAESVVAEPSVPEPIATVPVAVVPPAASVEGIGANTAAGSDHA